MPVVGSSMKITRGFPTVASATLRRRFIPPEKGPIDDDEDDDDDEEYEDEEEEGLYRQGGHARG